MKCGWIYTGSKQGFLDRQLMRHCLQSLQLKTLLVDIGYFLLVSEESFWLRAYSDRRAEVVYCSVSLDALI